MPKTSKNPKKKNPSGVSLPSSSSSNANVGFNAGANLAASDSADLKGVDILCYSIPRESIYTQEDVADARVLIHYQVISLNANNNSEMVQRYFDKLSDPQTARETQIFCIEQLLKKEGCYVFTMMDDKICGVEYTRVSDKCSYHIEEAGSYDTNDTINSKPKLTSGSRVVTESVKMEDQQNCVTRKVYEVNNPAEKPTLKCKVVQYGDIKYSFHGEFQTNADNVVCLENGQIKYQQGEHYTVINIKDNKIVSFLDYSREGGKLVEIYLDFQNKEESYLKYYKGKEQSTYCVPESTFESWSLESRFLSNIEEFSNFMSDFFEKLKIKKEQLKTQEDKRSIDDLVREIEGAEFIKAVMSNRCKKIPTATYSQQSSSSLQDETWEDSDEVVMQFYEKQEELRKHFSVNKSPVASKTVAKSRPVEVKIDEIGSCFAAKLVGTVMPEMHLAPPISSLDTTDSLPSLQSATPSLSPALSSGLNFYQKFEVSFLTEILHAVTFLLKEEEFRQDPYYQSKKDHYCNLLLNITDPCNCNKMSLDNLCEGLFLTAEQKDKLVAKFCMISQEKYSSAMQDFAVKKALETSYQRVMYSYQQAEIRYKNGDALKDQRRDLDGELGLR